MPEVRWRDFGLPSDLYPQPRMDDQPLLLAPPAEGYFMVRAGTGWQRLTIKDPLKGPGASG